MKLKCWIFRYDPAAYRNLFRHAAVAPIKDSFDYKTTTFYPSLLPILRPTIHVHFIVLSQ